MSHLWIISEGSPGHVSQSAGLAAAIGEKLPVHVRQFETRPRLKGFMRTWIRQIWMGKKGRALPDWMLDKVLRLERPQPGEAKPDLIISSGGRSVFAARSLSVKHGIPFVFLGERKPYPPDWFHTVFTPSSLETSQNDLRMDVIPTKITPSIVKEAAANWAERPSGRLWTMLIGGSSRSHDFKDSDWEKLAAGMIEQSRREGIRWLVTTSRRTGMELEARIRGLLPPDIVADAVWWCHQPEKRFAAYLGAAESIWVTQDSVSMVTEAVAAGKPVVVVYPKNTPFPATSFMPGYLANLEQLGLISRVPMDQTASYKPAPTTASRKAITTSGLAEIALQRLGWAELKK